MTSIARRTFVTASAAALAVPVARRRRGIAAALLDRMDGGLPATYPAHDPEDVRAVVGKSHVDCDAVRAMVAKRPALAKAAWDWGFGDWESALGAASHMGRRDIAEVLMANGARPNLYTYAMLGRVDVVRAICAASPGIHREHGPHGITLMQHARAGGDEAAGVIAYLEELGDADVGPPNRPIAEAEATARYVGAYVPVGAAETTFHVGWHERRRGLTFRRDGQVLRFLTRTAEHVFAPVGAAAVRLVFAVEQGRATALSIRDGDLEVRAERTPAAAGSRRDAARPPVGSAVRT